MSTELNEAPTHPLTREEREGLNALSARAYGKRLQWQKMLRRGELRQAADMTKNGEPMAVKKLHHFTLKEIYDTMNKIISDHAEAVAKAAAEKKDENGPA